MVNTIKNIKDTVIIITGAGRGLGREIALKCAEKQAKVCLISRTYDELKSLADYITKTYRTDSFFRTCDISVELEIGNYVEDVMKKFGRIDTIINNAAVAQDCGIDHLSSEEWNEIININLTGPFLMTKYVIDNMIKNANGTIINISSISGLSGYPKSAAYCATKFGLLGFSESISKDLHDKGITVYTVCPAQINTEMLVKASPDVKVEKALSPAEVATSIISLLEGRIKIKTGNKLIIYTRRDISLRYILDRLTSFINRNDKIIYIR